MNLTNNPEKSQLRELFAKCNDLAGNHQLLVYKDGEVKIALLPTQGSKVEFYREVQYSLEIWIAGNNYTGHDASLRDHWIDRVFESIMLNWEKESKGIISIF